VSKKRNIYIKDRPINRVCRFMGRLLKTVGIVGAGVALLGGVSVVLILSYRYVLSSPLFLNEEVEVLNTHHLTKSEVISLAGIKRGVNIFDVNLSRVRDRLLGSQWIEDVVVRRVLPHRIVIEIKERVPCFIGIYRGRIWYLDKDARPIAPMEENRMIPLPMLWIKGGKYDRGVYEFLTLLSSFLRWKDIGWVGVGRFEIRCYDYRRGILWIFERDALEREFHTARLIWQDLERRGEVGGVRRIWVIKDLGWVTHKYLAG